MIILDTNVLSELMKADPSTNVVGWTAAQPPSSLFTTTITQAEIAAITRSRGAAVATRNASDFKGCGIHVVNPWDT